MFRRYSIVHPMEGIKTDPVWMQYDSECRLEAAPRAAKWFLTPFHHTCQFCQFCFLCGAPILEPLAVTSSANQVPHEG